MDIDDALREIGCIINLNNPEVDFFGKGGLTAEKIREILSRLAQEFYLAGEENGSKEMQDFLKDK